MEKGFGTGELSVPVSPLPLFFARGVLHISIAGGEGFKNYKVDEVGDV